MNISLSKLRQNLKKTIDLITTNHEPIFVTCHQKQKAVLLCYDDYRSLEETAYLLKSPANAKQLLESLSDLNNHRKFNQKDLIDD